MERCLRFLGTVRYLRAAIPLEVTLASFFHYEHKPRYDTHLRVSPGWRYVRHNPCHLR